LKDDGSKVTNIDHYLSKQIKLLFAEDDYFKEWNYYSEEDYQDFHFPMIAIDPIDGTEELINKRPEFTISVAFMLNSTLGFGWVFNPLTEFEMMSHERKQSLLVGALQKNGPFLGLVSRREWRHKAGQLPEDLIIVPKGSIAFKLALLGAGACDFVYTFGDKGIWDVAAGTFICREKGIRLYFRGQEVQSFEKSIVKGPLLWCRPELLERILPYIE
jgi:myo-inositol-1(or 4)-monophosphatase